MAYLLSIIKNNSLIIIIFVLALIMRLIGVTYGLPDFTVGDEQSIVYGSLKMLELKTLVPAWYPEEFRPLYYPPFMSYIFLIFLLPVLGIKFLVSGWGLEQFKQVLILDQTLIWLIARTVTAFLGAGTVILIYKMAQKLFNKQVALYSSLFLAFSFIHLSLSHFARHWVPATFFTMLYLTIWFNIDTHSKTRHYVFVGLLAGLAFGVSYITSIGLAVIVVSYWFNNQEVWYKKFFHQNWWYLILSFIWLSGLFIFLHPQEFIRILFGEDSTLGGVKSLGGLFDSFVYHLVNLWYLEPILLIFILFGTIVLLKKDLKKLFVLWSLPIIYITIVYLFFHNEVRYIVLVLPILSVIAGVGLEQISKSEPFRNRLFRVWIIILVFLFPVLVGVKYDKLILKLDTRNLAKVWIANNVNIGSRIITYFYDFKLIPTKNSIKAQFDLAPDSLRQFETTLLKVDDKDYPSPAYDVLPLHFLSEVDLSSYLGNNNYEYIAISYWGQEDVSPKVLDLLKQGDLVARFSSGVDSRLDDLNYNWRRLIVNIFFIDNLGPNIEIWKLKYKD